MKTTEKIKAYCKEHKLEIILSGASGILAGVVGFTLYKKSVLNNAKSIVYDEHLAKFLLNTDKRVKNKMCYSGVNEALKIKDLGEFGVRLIEEFNANPEQAADCILVVGEKLVEK